MIASIGLQRAQLCQVCATQVDEGLQDAVVDVRIGHGDIRRLQRLDHGQRLDGLLGLRILLGVRQGQRGLGSNRLHQSKVFEAERSRSQSCQREDTEEPVLRHHGNAEHAFLDGADPRRVDHPRILAGVGHEDGPSGLRGDAGDPLAETQRHGMPVDPPVGMSAGDRLCEHQSLGGLVPVVDAEMLVVDDPQRRFRHRVEDLVGVEALDDARRHILQ